MQTRKTRKGSRDTKLVSMCEIVCVVLLVNPPVFIEGIDTIIIALYIFCIRSLPSKPKKKQEHVC